MSEQEVSQYDEIYQPQHHTAGGIENIAVISAKSSHEEYTGYVKGNTIKYILRAGKKGSALIDLKKARRYLDWWIEAVQEDTGG